MEGKKNMTYNLQDVQDVQDDLIKKPNRPTQEIMNFPINYQNLLLCRLNRFDIPCNCWVKCLIWSAKMNDIKYMAPALLLNLKRHEHNASVCHSHVVASYLVSRWRLAIHSLIHLIQLIIMGDQLRDNSLLRNCKVFHGVVAQYCINLYTSWLYPLLVESLVCFASTVIL